MAGTRRSSYRLNDEDVARIKLLSKAWGGIAPASDADVIREALRRAVESLETPPKKKGKKSEPLS
jgi:hypothetical protein